MMTRTLGAPARPVTPAPAEPPGAPGVRGEPLAVTVLLIGTAVLYLWNLGASGWANGFYAAAVQAGAQSWTALLFGSSDAANAITVDKTPAALWVMGISARLFGFNPWSVLVPQALMGVAAVAVLYAAVRRVGGPGAALTAGVVLALTPAAALMFRFNNPDALLVLALVIAVYCTQRALERTSGPWWLAGAGAAIGIGFLAKMMQAFLVLPVLALVFAVCADLPWGTRLRRLLGAAAALTVSAGWYLLLVTLWPADSRPYIGGSQHNSILELALGYNGVGRLTGNETGGLGNLNHDVGWARLFGFQLGGHIGWLLPAALIALAAGLVITRGAARTDSTRAALLLWGGWLVGTAVTFSYMNGIMHPYYTVALAPAVAACLGIGGQLLWRRRADIRAATTLCGLTLITVGLSSVLLQQQPDWLPWLRWSILVIGGAAGLLLPTVGRWPARAAGLLGVVAMTAALAGTGAYTVATAATPHRGAIPAVGPASGFGGMPGFLDVSEPGPELIALLRADAADHTWVAAAVGSNNAAGYQLATGYPVLAVGGFNGTDPAPTLQQFQADVAHGRIHYFVSGSKMPGRPDTGSDAAARITDWVESNFVPQTVGGITVYDLSQ